MNTALGNGEAAVAATGKPTLGVVADCDEPVSEVEQGRELFEAGFDEACKAAVFLNHRAGPAAEARRGRATGWGVVLRCHNRTLAAARIAVELDETLMAAAPRWIVLRQELPNVVCIEFNDGSENETALEIIMVVEAFAIVVPRDHACPRRALAAPDAQQKDHLSGKAHLVADILARRLNLHPIRTPAERAVGRGVAAADQIDPEGLGGVGPCRRDRDGKFECGRCAVDLRQSFPDVADYQRAFDKRIVRDDVDGTGAVAARKRQQMLHHEMRNQSAVLAAGETDDPGFVVRLRILIGDLPSNRVEHMPLQVPHSTDIYQKDAIFARSPSPRPSPWRIM